MDKSDWYISCIPNSFIDLIAISNGKVKMDNLPVSQIVGSEDQMLWNKLSFGHMPDVSTEQQQNHCIVSFQTSAMQ